MKSFFNSLPRYWKTVVAVVGALVVIGNQVVAAVNTAYGDGKWDLNDTITVAIVVFTAVGVYLKTNQKPVGAPVDPTISEADSEYL